MAYKGEAAQEEAAEAEHAAKVLGLKLLKILPAGLPGRAHSLVVYEKIVETPKGVSAKIRQNKGEAALIRAIRGVFGACERKKPGKQRVMRFCSKYREGKPVLSRRKENGILCRNLLYIVQKRRFFMIRLARQEPVRIQKNPKA